jgi:outer membrane protein OmpA-like peptidoglycan-associated protein
MGTLRMLLREDATLEPDHGFSLRQIRENAQVRDLVPAIELDSLVFETGSAALPSEQARTLVRLGILIEELLFENPREVFLIEGHTDATGSPSYNLALSDRRAENVALALTENFHIRPENLIVQGFGASYPKVQTETAEKRNRRVTLRRITPLLHQRAAR